MDLLDDVRDHARAFAWRMEAGEHMSLVLGLFDRCRSTYAGVVLLLRSDHVDEAIILSRPLFTESLMLAEVASADDSRRVELVMGLELATLADYMGIQVEQSKAGRDTADTMKWIEDRRKNVSAYGAAHGVSRIRHWNPDEKKLAVRHGRPRSHIDFRMANHWVHGSSLAISQRLSGEQDDAIVVGEYDEQKKQWAAPCGFFAAQSVLFALDAVHTITGKELTPEFVVLRGRVHDAAVAVAPLGAT